VCVRDVPFTARDFLRDASLMETVIIPIQAKQSQIKVSFVHIQ
jgi:hypothetical protein